MDCTHCGRDSRIRRFTLRFSCEERDPEEMELRLCKACLTDILAEDCVELVEPAIVMAAAESAPEKYPSH